MLPTVVFVSGPESVTVGLRRSRLISMQLTVLTVSSQRVVLNSPKTTVTRTDQLADSGHDHKCFRRWLVLVEGHQGITSPVISRSDWPRKNGEASQAEQKCSFASLLLRGVFLVTTRGSAHLWWSVPGRCVSFFQLLIS